MAYFEFPHTRTYDSDLGWLIKHFKELLDDTTALQKWAAEHKTEYNELSQKVDGLIDNLIDVVVPWDSSIAYRIFSIVEYQGVNYIAVQDVPVGTMITNTDYWQPANTVVEQINAIAVEISDIEKNKVDFNIYQMEPDYLHKVDKWETLKTITDYPRSYNVLQGGDYDSLTDEYIVAYTNPSNSGAVLVAYNTNYEVTRFSDVLPLGHANDIAYVPDNNRLYVAVGRDNNGQVNQVVEIDATTLTQLQIITPPFVNGGYAWYIAYDKNNKRFYVQNDDELIQTDINFNLIKSVEFAARNFYKGNTHFGGQCSFFANGIYYNLNLIGNGSAEATTETNLGNTNVVVCFDEDLNYLYNFYIREKAPKDEVECVCVLPDDQTAIIIYGQYYLTFAEIKLSKNAILNRNYAEGISTSRLLENGEDLNDILSEGRCYSNSATKTATLLNVPKTGYGFDLFVDHLAGYHIIQRAYYIDGTAYERIYNKGSDSVSWSGWKLIGSPMPAGNSVNLTYMPFCGFLTGSGTSLYFTIPWAGIVDTGLTYAFSSNTKMVIRGINGYANPSGSAGDLLSNYTVTISRRTAGFIVEVNGLPTNAAINNTPVTVMFNAGTFDIS